MCIRDRLWACCWGCVKDELHNTPYPDLGTVMVAADWSGRSSDAAVPGMWELLSLIHI